MTIAALKRELKVALEILVAQHRHGDEAVRKDILKMYLRNTRYINNWDLVDLSCGEVVGGHLKVGSTKLLDRLAKSKSMWERRIAMISTMALVRQGDVEDALRVAEMLLDDQHDLIHKAVGWVLRVVGDQDRVALLEFLKQHYERVPRTALRYGIEHFSEQERKAILAGKFVA